MADTITPNVVVSMPSQLFTLARSLKAAAGGKIYIGKIDTDPTIPENQIQVYIQNEDDSLVPIAQPININTGGYPVYGGQISKFVTVEGHSMAVYDAYNVQQFYFPNVLKYDPDQLRQQLAAPGGYLLVNDAVSQSQLSSSIGATMVGYMQSTLSRKLKEMVSIQDYMSEAEIADANSANPVMNHTHALIEARQESPVIFFPDVASYYNIGDAALPDHTVLFGYSTLPYTITGKESLKGVGAAICVADGASSVFKFNLYVALHGLAVWGGGPARGLSGLTKNDLSRNLQRISLYQCGFYGFAAGIGNLSYYVNEVDALLCHVSGNNYGVRNTIDSKYIGGYINANLLDGVRLLTGANDNLFVGVKNEWNGAANYYGFSAKHNVIIGGICDRASGAGVVGINAQWIIDALSMRRNGKDSINTNNCTHLYLEGPGAKILLSAIDTEVGANDDGSGDITPQYSIVSSGASTNMTLVATGGDFAGCTVAPLKMVTEPLKVNIKSNIGIDDRCNTGPNRVVNAYGFTDGKTKQILGAGQTLSIPLTQPAIGSTVTLPPRQLKIAVRDTATGVHRDGLVTLKFSVESFGASAAILEVKSYTPGVFGTSGALVNISVTGVSADASAFNIVLVSTDLANREVGIFNS
ncbi:phage head-binding domain-containing protein [Serratia sp. JSRIV006]|uniref:phage head-binding domain-containing protein n=1 Tax=Serratia sp. JSRIV006 TaxID=2831896 RepID=UPI001CBCADE0|nr:phage head-binding domain-containing protein [Serratia sp. JSRIV006]